MYLWVDGGRRELPQAETSAVVQYARGRGTRCGEKAGTPTFVANSFLNVVHDAAAVAHDDRLHTSAPMVKATLSLQRHPRYTLALAAFILCAYWFLSSPTPRPRAVAYNANNELKARLEREERKYRAMLPQRQELITRFGPTPAQVVMYVASCAVSRRHF